MAMKRQMLIAAFVSLNAGGITLAAAQGDSKTLGTESAKMDSLATSQGNLKVESRIGSDFNAFAGSTANSSNLVTGLRTGSDITLSSTDAKGVVTTTTFTPPTGKMGYGNVYTSLALAKHQLAGIGITQPTAQELQAAMIGGNVTTIGPNGQTTTTALTGVLTLRSQGMGWGQIAQTYGTKLGPVISGMKAANTHVSTLPAATTKAAPASGVTRAGGASSSGVTTAAGGSNPGQGNGNAYGRGVTTAGGGAAGQGNGNAYGRGITTGAGGTPGNSGNAGQAKGAGKGG
jgi:hypothetical protein